MTDHRDHTRGYEPYRYLDPERRSADAFADLNALALDLHARRNGRALHVEDRWDPWDYGDGQRAGVVVQILANPSGDVLDTFLILTAGERAQTLLDALAATRKRAA